MAYGETGDVNVFSSLSRVGFNDRHTTQEPSSLLTFADFVLALDNKKIPNDGLGNSITGEQVSQEDHTYASIKIHKMTTRSQALRINQCETMLNKRDSEQSDEKNNITESESCLSHSDPGEMYCATCSHPQSSVLYRDQSVPIPTVHKCATKMVSPNTPPKEMDIDKKVKRSSSVENITTEYLTTDSFSEWPQRSRKNSPRKSCSFEEVNTESQKPEDKRRGGSSGQLHRLINDTLEFPCWPRKADHTYATATWDGTAASHSLFEQEINQEIMKVDEVEDTEVHASPVKKRSSKLSLCLDEQNRTALVFQNHPYQKEDHTYVKQNVNSPPSTFTNFEGDSFRKSGFCSTFPRQKSRDDHTYFSSGLNRHGCFSSGKDWNNVHVTNFPHNKERTHLNGKNLPVHFNSAKKDHNYFSSAT